MSTNVTTQLKDLKMDEFSEEELAHFGVPGMKWGVTRRKSSSNAEAEVVSKRKMSDVTDAELKTMINRMRLENEYLTLATPPPKQVSKGQKIVMDLLLDVGVQSAKAYLTTGKKPHVVEMLVKKK